MTRNWTAGLQLAAAACAVAALALVAACDSTPTEPSNRVAMSVDVSAGPTGTGNTITVRANVCGCSRAALEIEVDGAEAGRIGCGEERVLTVGEGRHTVKIFSSTLASALTATPTVGKDAGVILRISCS